MITRGAYIGEIVDELSTIAEQVKNRNRLGLNDLSVFAENFYRDLLNLLLGIKLKNLNANRSNEPGLDLGDIGAKIAFQVTSSATSAKINATLLKLTPEHEKAYDKIVVLAIGKAQGSYTSDPTLWTKCNFTADDIWDITTLARKAVELEIESLSKLVHLIRTNVVPLRVDLEIPDEEGRYPTSGYEKWEERAKPKVGDGNRFFAFCKEEGAKLSKREQEELKAAIESLGRRLSRTPRLTREFLATLFERKEPRESKRAEGDHILYDKVLREFTGGDLDGELRILAHEKFAHVDHEDPQYLGPPEIIMTVSDNDDLRAFFSLFVKKKGLSFRSVIGSIDLSEF